MKKVKKLELLSALASLKKTRTETARRRFDSRAQVASRQAMATAAVGEKLGRNPLLSRAGKDGEKVAAAGEEGEAELGFPAALVGICRGERWSGWLGSGV
jgi:hypothetical protein